MLEWVHIRSWEISLTSRATYLKDLPTVKPHASSCQQLPLMMPTFSWNIAFLLHLCCASSAMPLLGIESYVEARWRMLELLETHLWFIFPKVFPCLLVIISHYPISYILGENIPPREYSLLVDTSVWLVELSLDVALVLSPCNIGIITMLIRPFLGIITRLAHYPWFPELTHHYSLFNQLTED